MLSLTTYLEDNSGYFKPQDLSREVSLSSFGNGGDDLPHKGIDDDNIYDADGYVQASLWATYGASILIIPHIIIIIPHIIINLIMKGANSIRNNKGSASVHTHSSKLIPTNV